jgi:hypothetical protein
MCVLPMQPDNEGVRQMRGCGGLDGGGIAADYNGQTSTYSVSSGPMRKSASAPPTCQRGLDWGGLVVWRFRVDQRDGGDGSTRTPPSKPSTVADTSGDSPPSHSCFFWEKPPAPAAARGLRML